VRRVLLVLTALLVLAPAAGAATTPKLAKDRVEAAFLHDGKVARWVKRYPPATRSAQAVFDPGARSWGVIVSSTRAGVIADGTVSDDTGRVTTAWTGPQVDWPMARGYRGLFGGRWLNSWPVWIGFCVVFLAGLADLRRPFSLRNLDLLVLLSFTVSLWYFNRGDIFTSVPLVYPPLVYLLGRCAWIGLRGRSPAGSAPVWPVWLLVAATVVLVGFRIGLNVLDSNVIDVGYSGVVGAQRIAAGQSPYGHFPEAGGPVCGKADPDGIVLGRLQVSGRCEVPLPEGGDTYGPVAYESYLPAFLMLGWTGDWFWTRGHTGGWHDLPAAHLTAIGFDLACLLLLALLGWRMGGARTAVTLGFAWAAYPFTQYVSSSNSNDAIPPAFLLAGLILVAFPWARGVGVALSGWTKFASLLLVPLWASYPDGVRRPRATVEFAIAALVASELAFAVLLLEPHHVHAATVFYHRAIAYQLGRSSPFSLWDWGRYHAGLPDLHLLQRVLEVLVVAAAIGVAFLPRRKSLLQLVALTGCLLIGVELVMTHWFYLYIAWFFPFVVVAVLGPPGKTDPPAPVMRSEGIAGSAAPLTLGGSP
jgi:hypothetical protein